jgi:hypothetical protein
MGNERLFCIVLVFLLSVIRLDSKPAKVETQSILEHRGLPSLSVVHVTSMSDLKRAAITIASFIQFIPREGMIEDYILIVPPKVYTQAAYFIYFYFLLSKLTHGYAALYSRASIITLIMPIDTTTLGHGVCTMYTRTPRTVPHSVRK